jgi:2-keto-4-pentenoate hydratase/2-oxohepta-3-ene-1,7-dioic acid hydratase in catechol pathway
MTSFGRARVGGRETWVVERDGEILALPGPPWEGLEPSTGPLDVAALDWLPPVMPGKILCVGRNYALHAKERGAEVPAEPLLFLKAPSALVVSGGDVVLPKETSHVELEGEMAFVIGRRVRRLPPDVDPASVIVGWLCADDVTARDLQRRDGQWSRAKGFDTACPVSRLVGTTPPPRDARLRTRLNGELKQDAALADMIFDVAAILAHASAMLTLMPGDLVLTGTPAGCAPLAAGDRVSIEIDGLDPLLHGVRAE